MAETSAPFLWTSCPAPDGTLWAGTGNEGQVLKIARDGKTSTFFDAAEMEVHALAPAPSGGLYVATSPDGKIYEVAANGTAKTFFDPDDKYIWALAVAPDGARLRRHRRKGQHLSHHARRQGLALLQDQHHQRGLARRRQERQPARRHRVARPDLPHRQGTARRSCCSTRRTRKSTR